MPGYAVTVTYPDYDALTQQPGLLFLPGAPVTGYYPQATCACCDHPLTHAGSADPATGADVTQAPGTGQHDGIVAFTDPYDGGSYAHTRCLLDGNACLTVDGGADTRPRERQLRQQAARTAAAYAVDERVRAQAAAEAAGRAYGAALTAYRQAEADYAAARAAAAAAQKAEQQARAAAADAQ